MNPRGLSDEMLLHLVRERAAGATTQDLAVDCGLTEMRVRVATNRVKTATLTGLRGDALAVAERCFWPHRWVPDGVSG